MSGFTFIKNLVSSSYNYRKNQINKDERKTFEFLKLLVLVGIKYNNFAPAWFKEESEKNRVKLLSEFRDKLLKLKKNNEYSIDVINFNYFMCFIANEITSDVDWIADIRSNNSLRAGDACRNLYLKSTNPIVKSYLMDYAAFCYSKSKKTLAEWQKDQVVNNPLRAFQVNFERYKSIEDVQEDESFYHLVKGVSYITRDLERDVPEWMSSLKDLVSKRLANSSIKSFRLNGGFIYLSNGLLSRDFYFDYVENGAEYFYYYSNAYYKHNGKIDRVIESYFQLPDGKNKFLTALDLLSFIQINDLDVSRESVKSLLNSFVKLYFDEFLYKEIDLTDYILYIDFKALLEKFSLKNSELNSLECFKNTFTASDYAFFISFSFLDFNFPESDRVKDCARFISSKPDFLVPPVVIRPHMLGGKNTSFDQEYLKACIESVILNTPKETPIFFIVNDPDVFSDIISKNFFAISFDDVADNDYYNFINLYVHRSTNHLEFEMFSIASYFLIRSLMKELSIDDFLIVEGDTLILRELNEFYRFYGDTYLSNKVTCCFARLSLSLINEYCDSALKIYNNTKNIEVITKGYEKQLSHNLPGGFNDMTIWNAISNSSFEIKTNSKWNRCDILHENSICDHFFHSVDEIYCSDRNITGKFKVKKYSVALNDGDKFLEGKKVFYCENTGYFLYEMESGDPIVINTAQFGGIYKYVMVQLWNEFKGLFEKKHVKDKEIFKDSIIIPPPVIVNDYNPVYTWPNKAFPFRLFYDGINCRIFIIENLQHNFEWLAQFRRKIKSSDLFFVILGSHWNEYLLKNAIDMMNYLELSYDNFIILYNDKRDEELFSNSDFKGVILNQNCWLDYNGAFNVQREKVKKYDAVYVGRMIPVKRHYLASLVNNLALVSGIIYSGNVEATAPPHIYRNSKPLTPDEVSNVINSSYCGLILSEKEGACFASSEYLLCGVPVVSTLSEGGRAVWYDDYNSIVCSPDSNSIKKAVEFFCDNARDPYVIRNRHIKQSNQFRELFIELLGSIFQDYSELVDARQYFEKNYFHKMRNSHKPNFELIFSGGE